MYLTEVLARCSDIETRIARVYRTLALRCDRRGPNAQLWRELAVEEETHASILRRELESFEELDETGAFVPEFAPRLEHVGQQLDEIEARAVSVQTLDEATMIVVAMEQTEIEDLYDDLVTQGYPAFKIISDRLEAFLMARGIRSGRRAKPAGLGTPRREMPRGH